MSSSAPLNVKNPQNTSTTLSQNSSATAAVATNMSQLAGKMQTDAALVSSRSDNVVAMTGAYNDALTNYQKNPTKANKEKLDTAQQNMSNAVDLYNQAKQAVTDDGAQMDKFLEQLPAARQQDASDARATQQADDQIKDAEKARTDADAKLNESDAKIAKAPANSPTGGVGDSFTNKPKVGGAADAGVPNANDSDITSDDDTLDNKVINASASGSSVDAATVLQDNGISDPASYWESQQDELVNKKHMSKELFNSILDTLQNSGTDAQGKEKAQGKNGAPVNKGKAAGGAGAAAGAPAGEAGHGPVGAAGDAGVPAGTTSSTPTRLVGAGANSGAPGEAVQVDPSNLSPMEIMMLVMLMATDELNKEIQQVAKDLQNSTAEKNQIRQALSDNNQHISYDPNNNSTESTQAKKNQTNLQNKLDSIGDDTQMMQMRLQNLMQMQQQFIQAVSNISKSLSDNSMAILRHIGS